MPHSSAKNGKLALQEILNTGCDKCNGFEVVFMDLNMPVMDGIDATKEIMKMKGEGKIYDKI